MTAKKDNRTASQMVEDIAKKLEWTRQKIEEDRAQRQADWERRAARNPSLAIEAWDRIRTGEAEEDRVARAIREEEAEARLMGLDTEEAETEEERWVRLWNEGKDEALDKQLDEEEAERERERKAREKRVAEELRRHEESLRRR